MTKFETCFGAANGFSGFRSNFDVIFSPTKLERLFIIKGGPGTGKSTLMRKIQSHYEDRLKVTKVLCSSDSDSLDGLLLSENDVTVGIVDGTAPHVVEPMYPGAKETLVNLGDAFDYEYLREHKTEITDLSDRKRSRYKSAYKSLKIAGDIFNYIRCEFLNNRYYIEAENIIQSLISDEQIGESIALKSPLLIGSFSKTGYQRICDFAPEKQLKTIKGDGISEYVFMMQLLEILKKKCINLTFYPSAFSEEIPDMIETNDFVYTVCEGFDYTIDTTSFIPKICEYDRLRSSYKCFIENAQIALIKAADYHFKMEDIYSAAMRFDVNEKKYCDIVEDIDTIFDK